MQCTGRTAAALGSLGVSAGRVQAGIMVADRRLVGSVDEVKCEVQHRKAIQGCVIAWPCAGALGSTKAIDWQNAETGLAFFFPPA